VSAAAGWLLEVGRAPYTKRLTAAKRRRTSVESGGVNAVIVTSNLSCTMSISVSPELVRRSTDTSGCRSQIIGNDGRDEPRNALLAMHAEPASRHKLRGTGCLVPPHRDRAESASSARNTHVRPRQTDPPRRSVQKPSAEHVFQRLHLLA